MLWQCFATRLHTWEVAVPLHGVCAAAVLLFVTLPAVFSTRQAEIIHFRPF